MFKIFRWFFYALGNYKTTTINSDTSYPNLDNVEIQVLDITGNWRTCHVTRNISSLIAMEMNQLSDRFPGQRIRAIDNRGNLVNIM